MMHFPHRYVLVIAALLLLLNPYALAGNTVQPGVAGNQQAQRSWWDRAPQKKIGAYWIKTDVDPKRANELARHLNLMYAEYSRRLASLPARGPEELNVMIFQTQRDYLHTLRARFGVDGTGSGGLFFASPSGSALAFWIEDLPQRRIEHVLQHEGFHQFAYSRFGTDLPIWANEGLAEFFGEAVMVDRRLVLGQTTPRVINNVRNAIETGDHIPLRVMLTMDGDRWIQTVRNGDASMLYQQAWSMVQFLVYAENGRYQKAFEQYLHLLNRGFKSEDAFVRAFGGADIEGFEKKWIEYAKNARPSSFVTAMERVEFLAAGALELSRSKILPESLDELKKKLQETGFSFTHDGHGFSVTLEADDEAMYTIPQDDLAREQPVFIVEPFDQRRLSRRERMLEDQHPTPPTIRTEHLKPHNLKVNWIRDKETGELRYDIAVTR